MSLSAPRYRRSTLLCGFFIALIGGIALAKVFSSSVSSLWLVLPALLVGLSFRMRRSTQLLAILLFGLLLGWWRGGVYLQQLSPYSELNGKKVVMTVTADSSGVYGQNSQLEFDGSHVNVLAPYEVKIPGRVLISGFGANSILRGDTVSVSGTLHIRRGSKQAGISYGQIQVLSRSGSYLEKVRRDFLAGLATALPEPNDQFAAGLLIGQRSELSDNVTNTLRIVGLSHVIAVSGYNLTILAEVARKRFGKKSAYRSTIIGLVLVVLFVALAGSSASIARAAFVSILTIVAAHYGRSVKPLLLILLAAGYTAFANPLNIWTDIGWYLSFLAFFGVLVVAPAVQNRIYKHKKEPSTYTAILIETASAQIMTIPIVMYIFAQVSLVSLVANIIVVPLVPLAMLLSLFAGLAGMLVPTMVAVIAWPARVLLDFMLGVSALLARIPHALASVGLSVYGMVLIYAIIILLVIVARHKTPARATITE